MTKHAQLAQAVAILRDGPVPLRNRADSQAQRERLLPQLRNLVAATPRRLHRKRLIRRGLVAASSLLVAGAALLVFYGFEHRTAPVPSLYVETLLGSQTVGTKLFRSIAATGKLRSTENDGLRLLTRRGVEVTLAPKSEVELSALERDEQSSQLTLTQGSVTVHVPKLSRGNRFTVKTPSSEVIVHGTVFGVKVQSPGGSDCVTVEEGLVEVRRQDTTLLLGRGQSFGCETPVVTPSSEPALPKRVVATVPTAGTKAQSQRRPTSSVNEGGTLADETRLLSLALVAERRGNPILANQLFSSLLQKYPNSPLTTEAHTGYERTKPNRP